MSNSMIFIILGIILLCMKVGDVSPVSDWEWLVIAVPFLLAVCWCEIIEPLLGLDVRRQRIQRQQFESRVRKHQNKKPRPGGRGFPFR